MYSVSTFLAFPAPPTSRSPAAAAALNAAAVNAAAVNAAAASVPVTAILLIKLAIKTQETSQTK